MVQTDWPSTSPLPTSAVLGGESMFGAMLCSRLQSQYLAVLSAETRHDRRRGGADKDSMLGMEGIDRPAIYSPSYEDFGK